MSASREVTKRLTRNSRSFPRTPKGKSLTAFFAFVRSIRTVVNLIAYFKLGYALSALAPEARARFAYTRRMSLRYAPADGEGDTLTSPYP